MSKILILCTGNSSRSQMAEGFLKAFNPSLEVFSAGTNPASRVSRHAVEAMKEAGIDISAARPKNVDEYLGMDFDYVVTVCDNAKETCPVFMGKVKHRVHYSFEDPAEVKGTEEEIAEKYREVRDMIKVRFHEFCMKASSGKSLGFVGGGRVTRIIINAIYGHPGSFRKINVADINDEALNRLKADYPDIDIHQDDFEEALKSDYIFISLHPPVIIDFLKKYSEQMNKNAIVISLSPRISIESLQACLAGNRKVARLNPNSPSFVGQGFCPAAYSDAIPEAELAELKGLLELLGDCPEVEEAKIEAFALITAMGPTYLAFQVYELLEKAQSFGLSEEEAKAGVKKMLHGMADLIFESGLPKQTVLDLIPVKPMGQYENEIIDIYEKVLPPFYEKLKVLINP